MNADILAELRQLRDKVKRLEDLEEIRNLTTRYMQAMHDARWDDAVDCFSEEATYDHGVLGNLRDKDAIRAFYTKFMSSYEEAGGWAFDILSNPLITVDGDRGEGRWFLLTLLVDPDSKEAAWNVATLEYEYRREKGGWKFFRNRCISEHQLVDYLKGWGKSGGSRLSSISEAERKELPMNFEAVDALGGKQRPGKTCRSIRGWTVPTLEPGQ